MDNRTSPVVCSIRMADLTLRCNDSTVGMSDIPDELSVPWFVAETASGNTNIASIQTTITVINGLNILKINVLYPHL